jgi:hypothetical protein
LQATEQHVLETSAAEHKSTFLQCKLEPQGCTVSAHLGIANWYFSYCDAYIFKEIGTDHREGCHSLPHTCPFTVQRSMVEVRGIFMLPDKLHHWAQDCYPHFTSCGHNWPQNLSGSHHTMFREGWGYLSDSFFFKYSACNVLHFLKKQKAKNFYFYIKLSGFFTAFCTCKHVFALKLDSWDQWHATEEQIEGEIQN